MKIKIIPCKWTLKNKRWKVSKNGKIIKIKLKGKIYFELKVIENQIKYDLIINEWHDKKKKIEKELKKLRVTEMKNNVNDLDEQ